MRKACSFLFLFLVLYTTIGYYPLFKIFQYQIRTEIKSRIKQGIPPEELYCIVMAENETPEWVEKGKEFKYKGQLYDIVKKESAQGQIIYYCINDTQEAALFADLEEMIQKETEENSSDDDTELTGKFFSLYFTEKKKVVQPLIYSLETAFHYSFHLLSFSIEIEVPPPKSV